MSSKDIDIVKLENQIINFILKSTYDKTVHFKYHIVPNTKSTLDVITYGNRLNMMFVLFSTETEISGDQSVNDTKKILLENTFEYLKDITEPKETIGYEVYWHTDTDPTITKSIFRDYTIAKIIDKIFYENSHIIVDEMKLLIEPLW